jgi:hypothetical protein
MKKLSLVIEDLEVETFTVQATDGERGTVAGQQITGGMECNTRDVFWCSAQVTLNALDLNCYESYGGGYCTAVCPTGYEVCDTSPGVCG